LDVSEGSEDVLVEYAEFLSGNGYIAEAILRYRDLVNQRPDNPHYRTLLGNVYLVADLNSRAFSAYQAASTLAKDKQGWILANIGNILKNRGFYAEAIKYLQKALELEAGSQYAHERLAQAQQLEVDEGKKLESLLAEARQGLSKAETPHEPPAV
jgi:tetratricopeptide (TPR) repeat protein